MSTPPVHTFCSHLLLTGKLQSAAWKELDAAARAPYMAQAAEDVTRYQREERQEQLRRTGQQQPQQQQQPGLVGAPLHPSPTFAPPLPSLQQSR